MKSSHRGRAAALILLVTGTSTEALAADIKFCFEVYADYTDAGDPLRNGLAEDYWATQATHQVFRGGEYEVRLNSGTGTLLSQGNLGDGIGTGDPGSGCTPTITLSNVNQTYWYRLDSRSAINLNSIEGRRDDLNQTCFRSTTYVHSAGAGTWTIQIGGNSAECADVFRAMNAAGFSLYRHNGGNSGVNFSVRTGGACSNSTSGTTMCMSDAGANRKFTVSHEFGHGLTSARDGEITWGDCSQNDTKCPADGTGSADHAMASREQAKCAVREAIAHFVAADTYNNHNQEDCAFNYYKNYFPANPDLGQQVVDCEVHDGGTDQSALESGTTPTWALYPRKTMELVNPPNFSSPGCSTSWANRAVEVDYLRVFWNMHSHNPTTVSFTGMMNWWDNAFNFGQSNAYNELENTSFSQPGDIRMTWSAFDGSHGVDHP